jgi:hypothetical protein
MKGASHSSAKTFLTIAFAALLLMGCGKYEEGPSISLRAKKSRLVGNWKLDSAELGGVNVTIFYPIFDVSFAEDGAYLERIAVLGFTDEVYDGSWRFNDGKSSIRLDYDDGRTSQVEIKRLTNKELWIEFETLSPLTNTLELARIEFEKQ